MYRIFNGTLLQSISDYQWVKVKRSPHKPYIAFVTEHNKKIEWSYWSFNPILNLTEDPNGLYIRGQKLICPGHTISDYGHVLQNSITQRIIISHQDLLNLPQTQRYHITLFPHLNGTSLTDVLSSTFSLKFWSAHVFIWSAMYLFGVQSVL